MKYILRNTLLKIKKSVGRYLSIIFIIILGTAMFIGLRATSPLMILTIQEKIDQANLYDAKIVSTHGFSENTVKEIEKIQVIDTVVPGYSYFFQTDDLSTIQLRSYNDTYNVPELVSGRLPNKSNEVLASSRDHFLGETIKLIDEDYEDFISSNELEVVGLVNSVEYLTKVYGNAPTGSGRIDSYIFAPNELFTSDIFTEVSVFLKLDDKKIDSVDYRTNLDILNAHISVVEENIANMRFLELRSEIEAEIKEEEAEFNEEVLKAEKELADGLLEIEDAKVKIADAEDKIASFRELISQGSEKIKMEFANGIREINNQKTGIPQVDAVLDQLIEDLKIEEDKALRELLEGEEEIEKEEVKLFDAIKELEEAEIEYNDALVEFETEKKDAEEKIADAYQELEDLEKTEFLINTRVENSGIKSFYDDANKVFSISRVFPLFFFLVVALVVSNSMTRLVDEERGLSGTFVSLGYTKNYILSSYLLYVFIATTVGVIVGLFISYEIITKMIFSVYQGNYLLPSLIVEYDLILVLIVYILNLFVVSLVVYNVVRKELKSSPAVLLRPKVVSDGKAIMLERINFIWKRLGFIYKITIRNIVRNKKRMIMTILGVGGSTAVLLTGFGLQDSISSISTRQYQDIIKYDAFAVTDNYSEELILEFERLNLTNINIAYQEEIDYGNDIIAFLVVVDDPNSFKNSYSFIDNKTKEEVDLTNNGVIVTNKLTENLNIKDQISLTLEDQTKVLEISSINEHYLFNYIFMTKEYYQELFGEMPEYNTLFFNDELDQRRAILEIDDVLTVNYSTDVQDILDELVSGIGIIVILIIVFSLLLCLTVLYNLTIININERTREIATLKVLGFNQKEVNSYIFRETITLTTFGIIFGLILGTFLERFVILSAEGNDVSFGRDIPIYAYLLSAIITYIFALIIQIMTHFKLEQINMTESLKSVE